MKSAQPSLIQNCKRLFYLDAASANLDAAAPLPLTSMKSIARCDVKAFSEVIQKLYSPVTRASFPAHLAAALNAVMVNCGVTIDDIETDRRHAKKPRDPAAINRVVDSAQKIDRLPVKQTTELVTQRDFRPANTPSAQDQSDAGYSISIILHSRNRITRLMFRRQTNFSRRELGLLELLSPHISQAYAFAESRRPSAEPQRRRIGGERSDVRLTPRESEVLGWLAGGKRNREIGLILHTSSRTIQKQVQSILDKLNVETRCGAAAWWFEHRGGIT